MNYFESLKDYNRNEYLKKNPKKAEVIDNAAVAGVVSILPDSNNRAIVIGTPEKIFLQSYDTLILCVDKKSGKINKLWSGYSVTTMKHINTFLSSYNGMTLNKKAWENFKG